MRKFSLIAVFVIIFLLDTGCVAESKVTTRPNVPGVTSGEQEGPSQQGLSPVKSKKNDVFRGSCRNAPKPLTIKTYDGCGQANHPKVLYFDASWNGWKYWMSFTPYPNGNASYENPSIVVSNDGFHWVVPKGLNNPVTGVPVDASRGGHYSDPHLVMNGQTMELWYRYNPAVPKGMGTSHRISYIYMVTSKNGTIWSTPALILKGGGALFSPAIIFDGSKYMMWYSDIDGRLHYIESSDLKNWSAPLTVNLVLPGHDIWHQDVIKNGNSYKIVFSAFKNRQFSRNNQCLYYAFSPDGINFSSPVLILSPSVGDNRLDNQMIYRSSLVDIDGSYRLYYSAMSRKSQWHIFETAFNSVHEITS